MLTSADLQCQDWPLSRCMPQNHHTWQLCCLVTPNGMLCHGNAVEYSSCCCQAYLPLFPSRKLAQSRSVKTAVVTTYQPEGTLTITLLLQFFWNVLAAAGQPTWHVSTPIPLNCPGTITQATIAVSPNATLMAAIQTLEQPNRLHMISFHGNPTELSHATGHQSVQCQQVGMIEIPAGDALLECMFAPQSAGTSTMQA